VHLFDDQASYAPYTCFQCDEAWCMNACPVNAISISAAGAKVVSPELCVGCALCVIACPYGTVWYEPETHKAVKCDLCGGEPACVAACPTGAIEFAKPADDDWIGPWGAELDATRSEIEGGTRK